MQPFIRAMREMPNVSEQSLRDVEMLGVHSRIPMEQAHELLRVAVAVTGDSDLGLYAAQLTDFGYLETLEYAAGTAANWRDSVETIVKLARLLNEAARFRLDVSGGRAALVLSSATPVSRTAGDFCIAAIWRSIERWLGSEQVDREFHFAHPPPVNRSRYEQVFADAKLVFDAQDYAIVVDAAGLLRANKRHDPRLHRILMAHGECLLTELPKAESLTERVRQGIIDTMPDGSVSAERVALMLNMSRRTLSRQLHAEGTSFRALLEDVRQRFAIHYLESSNMGASDIAAMLGFSQSAAFVRAFRRWTGFAPGEYRRSLRA